MPRLLKRNSFVGINGEKSFASKLFLIDSANFSSAPVLIKIITQFKPYPSKAMLRQNCLNTNSSLKKTSLIPVNVTMARHW
jgi:hypothetical protein